MHGRLIALLAYYSLPVIMLVTGILWRRFPPRKRNLLYGFRTRWAMLSQETWDYANRVGAIRMIRGSWVLCLVSAVTHLWFLGDHTKMALVSMTTVQVIGLFALIAYMWIPVEIDLRKRFDDQGQLRIDCLDRLET